MSNANVGKKSLPTNFIYINIVTVRRIETITRRDFYYSSFNKLGLSSFVRSIACSSCQARMSLGFPLKSTSGTLHPLNSAGRVYTGGDTRPSWKLSLNADVSSEMAPGMSLMIESARMAAGSSPPLRT